MQNYSIKSKIILSLIAMIVMILGVYFAIQQYATPVSAAVEKLARCLQEKAVTMYGAYWCGHCQNQKSLFGESFQFVPYVECTEKTDQCLARNIQSYPTWILPDGRKLTGEQDLENLAQESGCVYAPEK